METAKVDTSLTLCYAVCCLSAVCLLHGEDLSSSILHTAETTREQTYPEAIQPSLSSLESREVWTGLCNYLVTLSLYSTLSTQYSI